MTKEEKELRERLASSIEAGYKLVRDNPDPYWYWISADSRLDVDNRQIYTVIHACVLSAAVIEEVLPLIDFDKDDQKQVGIKVVRELNKKFPDLEKTEVKIPCECHYGFSRGQAMFSWQETGVTAPIFTLIDHLEQGELWDWVRITEWLRGE